MLQFVPNLTRNLTILMQRMFPSHHIVDCLVDNGIEARVFSEVPGHSNSMWCMNEVYYFSDRHASTTPCAPDPTVDDACAPLYEDGGREALLEPVPEQDGGTCAYASRQTL